jgi:hypothetical protein
LRIAQLLAKGEDFRHQFQSRRKRSEKGKREEGRGKRAINESQDREIQI